MSSASYDFIIVGSGINGLAAASYVARTGLSTLVIEKREQIGGGAITGEITLPGFKHDIIATSINTWRTSPIEQELELRKYGYSDVDPDPVAATPFKNGKAVHIFRDLNSTIKSIAKFSERDAKKYEEVFRFYLDAKDLLHASRAAAPLSFADIMSTLEESDEGLDFLQLTYISARDWLEENFESEEMKAFLTLWASNHSPFSPEDAGSAIVILGFIGILQDKGVGVPIGGMNTLARAFGRYLEAHGGKIITGDEVKQITTKNDTATGVRLASGRLFEARKGILEDVEPRALFLRLVPDSAIDASFRKRVSRFRFSKVTEVMIHSALDGSVSYKSKEVSRAGIVQVGESLDVISRAYNDCVIGRMPETPFMTIDNTTYYDRSRVPKEGNKHILWNFVRAPAFINGKPWSDDEKEDFADRCMNHLSEYSPNISKLVLKRVVLSPQDIQEINPNMVNGDPGEGKPTLDQSLALRPFPKWSGYRTPVKRLYLCNPSTHPGGGISGLCGHNAAIVALKDLSGS